MFLPFKSNILCVQVGVDNRCGQPFGNFLFSWLHRLQRDVFHFLRYVEAFDVNYLVIVVHLDQLGARVYQNTRGTLHKYKQNLGA